MSTSPPRRRRDSGPSSRSRGPLARPVRLPERVQLVGVHDTYLICDTTGREAETLRISWGWSENQHLSLTLVDVVALRPRPGALGELRTASARAMERALRREPAHTSALVLRALRHPPPALSPRAQLRAHVLARTLPDPELPTDPCALEVARLALELAAHAALTDDLSRLAAALLTSAREAYEF